MYNYAREQVLAFKDHPEKVQELTDVGLQNAWQTLADISKDIDIVERQFIQEYCKRVANREKPEQQ